MRMPGTQIGFESDGKRCVLHAFVELKQMRMTRADADPKNFRRTFRRKFAEAFDREKKRAELDRAEFFAKGKIDIFRDVGKETESEVHLIACGPPHAGNVRVKIDKELFDSGRKIDRNEETFRLQL